MGKMPEAQNFLIPPRIMNYHITNAIYVITSNSLGQMQTRMDFFLLFKDYFIKKLLTKENQIILPSNDRAF